MTKQQALDAVKKAIELAFAKGQSTKPAIVIDVKGGLIQWIVANMDMDVYIIDHDNLESGAEDVDMASHPTSPDVIIEDIEDHVQELLSEYQYSEDED